MASQTRQAFNAFKQRLETRIKTGLLNAASLHSSILKQETTAHQTTPVGSKRRRGEEYQGQTVERSAPGEYPWREFGTLEDAIEYRWNQKGKYAESGVTEEGMHLVHLEFGSHWVSGERYDRLGMVRCYEENREMLADAFKEGFSVL